MDTLSSIWNNILGNGFYTGIVTTIFIGLTSIIFKPVRSFLYTWYKRIYYGHLRSVYYRIVGFSKNVTAYKSGHGIIVHEIELEILNKKHAKKFQRLMDISDSPTACKFNAFNTMKEEQVHNRFAYNGFWFKTIPEHIVSDVEQVCEMSHERRLMFNFIFDADKIANLKVNKILLTYGFSIPNLYPIEDGKFKQELLPEAHKKDTIDSAFIVNYKMDYYNFSIGFEDGIEVKEISTYYSPNGPDHKSKDVEMNDRNDLFYRKKTVSIKKPKYGSKIATSFRVGS